VHAQAQHSEIIRGLPEHLGVRPLRFGLGAASTLPSDSDNLQIEGFIIPIVHHMEWDIE